MELDRALRELVENMSVNFRDEVIEMVTEELSVEVARETLEAAVYVHTVVEAICREETVCLVEAVMAEFVADVCRSVGVPGNVIRITGYIYSKYLKRS